MADPHDPKPLARAEELESLVNKLHLAVAASQMGVWEYDEATRQVHWDDRMLEIYGITDGKNERPDDFWEKHIHPDDRQQLIEYSEECRLNNADFKHDYRIIRDDGTIRHIRSLARTVTTPGKGNRLVGVNIDVTEDYLRAEELRRAQSQLKHDARHDALTGLGNRRWPDEMTLKLFDRMGAEDRYCVLLLDLDHFKDVNDTLGHLAGDHILKTVARVMTSTIGDDGHIFRIGGDEFAVFFPKAPDEQVIEEYCATLVEAVGAPIPFEGETCMIGASIGYAFGIGPPDNSFQTFADADAALYEAKRTGRNTYRAYCRSLSTPPADVANARQSLLNAMKTDALICHYQPQYDARTLEIVGAEALVRWDCPDRGLVYPDEFLPEAARKGLVGEIDAHVLGIVTRQQTQWAAENVPFPTIAVNTSAERLRDTALIDSTRHMLKPHHRIAFELLETAFFDTLDDITQHNLCCLRDLDIRIDLDDFGTGHSSVAALQAIMPDQVKIDRSLVAPIETRAQQIMTVQALARLARLERADVVIEGLENGIQLAAIRNVDCDTLQGYALQRPMPADDFAALLTRSKRVVGM